MGLIPSGEPGKLLQWYDAGGTYALRNRTMDDLLDEIASYTGPTSNKYYLDVSAADVQPELGAVSGFGSIAALAVSGAAVFSVTAVSGTGSVAAVSAGAGSGTTNVDLAAVSGTGTLADVTVTVGGGGASATDDFTRSYAAWSSATAYSVGDRVIYSGTVYRAIQAGTNHTPLAYSVSDAYWVGDPGANWTAPSWGHLFGVNGLGTNGRAATCYPAGVNAGYWNGATFASNQFSEAAPESGVGSAAVRIQAAGCYAASLTFFDEGEGFVGIDYAISYHNGTSWSGLWSSHVYDAPGAVSSIRLEASGDAPTTLTLKVDGGTIHSLTHTALTGGAPGLAQNDAGPPNNMTTGWSGGDLP